MAQESLFSNRENTTPLASRVRPETIDDFVGQKQLLGEEKFYAKLLNKIKFLQ
ncbi:hypothetical protein TMUPMC115_2348 [Tetragenococcus muriaticus PMC-11-5]|uniref:Uncharacterized protein n=1 Tax=Tetragenococcus muriaticus PMC-11-5 TaxID=1302649 RepID=A0A091C0H7_9ENTE|nr:hypothetical protein TMUPMC115_2348 [Tetragenococcus muriaticus PMC-11-5]